ncbi:YjiH family protein [Halogeometricum borinquense]|uniref:YjiH family protein n=1 Tax=Halogeometricum borinquense TaxID=60847 RepID=A0A6C0ULV5_9EURY|nr:YjiH family protein [Halogeometricum borinquense]QIB76180.1 YjiH family protein [Halogeometricum borinquense]QIQ75378.1 YjiH family protein [Halogeometricum borinquense]
MATEGKQAEQTWTVEQERHAKSIEELDLHEIRGQPVVKFVTAFLIGAVFFLVPVPYQGELTVPFDIVVSTITETFPTAVGVYALAIIVAGGVLTTAARVGNGTVAGYDLSYFDTSVAFWILRLAGVVVAPVMFFKLGPSWLHTPGTGGLMWGTLVYSVGVIIPIGAVFITIFVELGGLEFVGTIARPVMRPLFKIPGRAALDSLASWVGSYSVGLYVTRNVFEQGGYNKRDVFTIATCFSTVSIGFVGVVAATLDILQLFPIIFGAYFLCVIVTAAILVRIPPISRVPAEYITEPDPETAFSGSPSEYVRLALAEAVEKADEGESFFEAAKRGFVDGLKLTTLILGTILTVGLAATLLSANTPIFDILGRPLTPVIAALGIPNAETVAPATIVGITEMYVPVLLVTETALKAKFFIAVLAVSQLIFFSSVGPMTMDMFSDVPIRFRDLVALFVMRTVLLVPMIAGMTHLAAAIGLFG